MSFIYLVERAYYIAAKLTTLPSKLHSTMSAAVCGISAIGAGKYFQRTAAQIPMQATMIGRFSKVQAAALLQRENDIQKRMNYNACRNTILRTPEEAVSKGFHEVLRRCPSDYRASMIRLRDSQKPFENSLTMTTQSLAVKKDS